MGPPAVAARLQGLTGAGIAAFALERLRNPSKFAKDAPGRVSWDQWDQALAAADARLQHVFDAVLDYLHLTPVCESERLFPDWVSSGGLPSDPPSPALIEELDAAIAGLESRAPAGTEGAPAAAWLREVRSRFMMREAILPATLRGARVVCGPIIDMEAVPPSIEAAPVVPRLSEMPSRSASRLVFDLPTYTVTLDGHRYKVDNAKAFLIFREIANTEGPITRAELRLKVKGINGKKAVRGALNTLPAPLAKTVIAGPHGFRIELPPLRKKKKKSLP
jgi:hypothetical protein